MIQSIAVSGITRRLSVCFVCTIVLLLSLGMSVHMLSQSSGPDAYIKGTNIEIGINGAGGYEGANYRVNVPPKGMHANTETTYFGFVANCSGGDWNSRKTDTDGDFFTPGAPENSWGITIGDGIKSIVNGCNGILGAVGTITDYSTVGDCISVTWEGNIITPVALHVKIVYLVHNPDRYYTTTVSITNTSTSVVPKLYYLRTVDPDNNVMWNKSYKTLNSVVRQPQTDECNIAQVKAEQSVPRNSYISLAAAGPNWRAGYGYEVINSVLENRDGSKAWNGTGYHSIMTVGANEDKDEAIYLVNKITNLLPGATENLKFVTILDDADAKNALAGLLYMSFPGSTNLAKSICTPQIDTVTICAGTAVSLSVTTGNASSNSILKDYVWTWTPSSVIDKANVNGDSVNAHPAVTTTIQLRGTPTKDCVPAYADSIVVKVIAPVSIDSVADVHICSGDNVPTMGFRASDPKAQLSWVLKGPDAGATVRSGTNTFDGFVARNRGSTLLIDTIEIRAAVPGGCEGIVRVVYISVAPEIKDTVSQSATTVCRGQSVDLFASGNDSYEWSPNIDLSAATGSHVVATPKASITYQLKITNSFGCSRTLPVNITVNPNPTLIDTSFDVCAGQTIELSNSVTGTNVPIDSYQWSGVSVSDEAAVVGSRTAEKLKIQTDQAGEYSYTLRVTDKNGCSTSCIDKLVVHALPVIKNSKANPVVHCLQSLPSTITIGDGINIVPTPASVSWTDLSGGNTIIGSSTQIVTQVSTNQTRVYRLTVSDANACAATYDVIVSINPTPDANVGPDVILCSCSPDSVLLGSPSECGEAPYVYQWSPITGIIGSASKATIAVRPSSTTTYMLHVVDSKGRIADSTVKVTVLDCPKVRLNDITVCPPQSTIQLQPTIEYAGSDALEYSWTPNDGSLDNAKALKPVIELHDENIDKVYNLKVINSQGCSGTATVHVRASRSAKLSIASDASCPNRVCRNAVVHMSANLLGGGPNPSYKWTDLTTGSSIVQNSANQATAQPLQDTKYEVLVSDANGCAIRDTLHVCVDPEPDPHPGVDTTICEGTSFSQGTNSHCGVPGFVYSWTTDNGTDATINHPDKNAAIAQFHPLRTTKYTLKVTTENGSGPSNSASFTVTVLPKPSLKFDDLSACLGDAKEVTVHSANGRKLDYHWVLDDLNVKEDLAQQSSVLSIAGLNSEYHIKLHVVDSQTGCTTDTVLILTMRPLPEITAGGQRVCCAGQSVQLDAKVSGGTPPYVYAWTPSDDLSASNVPNPTAVVRTNRTYTLKVTDANGTGCSQTKEVSVGIGKDPQISAQFSMGTVKADPHNKSLSLPITVTSYPATIQCEPSSLDFSVDYNAWLFDPAPEFSNGVTVVSNELNGDTRSIRLHLSPVPHFTAPATLTTIKGAVLLGEADSTDFVLRDFIWGCSDMNILSTNGRLVLDSLCLKPNGAPRLLHFAQPPVILSIVPNPARDFVELSMQRFYSESVTVSISSLEGLEIRKVEWPAGNNSSDSTPEAEVGKINMDLGLAQGVYQISIRSALGSCTERLIVIR